MTLFVDASALVAFVAHEPEREELKKHLASAPALIWSAMTCWEAVAALQSSYVLSVDAARTRIAGFADEFDLKLVDIGAAELDLALDAYQTYGRGRHRAKLNFGDCFAYACAKANGASLLYKGDDFTHTDLA